MSPLVMVCLFSWVILNGAFLVTTIYINFCSCYVSRFITCQETAHLGYIVYNTNFTEGYPVIKPLPAKLVNFPGIHFCFDRTRRYRYHPDVMFGQFKGEA